MAKEYGAAVVPNTCGGTGPVVLKQAITELNRCRLTIHSSTTNYSQIVGESAVFHHDVPRIAVLVSIVHVQHTAVIGCISDEEDIPERDVRGVEEIYCTSIIVGGD